MIGGYQALKDHQDAYGHEIYDHFMAEAGSEVVERDDGYVCASPGPKAYLAQYDDWSPAEQEAMAYV